MKRKKERVRALADTDYQLSSSIIPKADKSLGDFWRPPPGVTRDLANGVRKLRGEHVPEPKLSVRATRIKNKKPRTDGQITLKELARLANTTPKQARVKLRKSDYPKPAAGWIFPTSDTDRIIEIIT